MEEDNEIAEFILSNKLLLTSKTFRGWQMSIPYPFSTHAGFMLYKKDICVSVAVGATALHLEPKLLETGCCYERFNTLEEVIDHIEQCEELK